MIVAVLFLGFALIVATAFVFIGYRDMSGDRVAAALVVGMLAVILAYCTSGKN
ncbi:MAG: hypothetical protein JST12_14635 [Armatimonadetes bacterium]|nr:hypothetical protein [Armatimonadota bacterium]